MPTIKRKVEMNLPQLIEWASKNIDKVKSEIFLSNARDVFGNYATVQFSVDGYAVTTEGITHDDTFTIELEEEINEDTKLDLVERFIGGMGSVCYTSHSMSIKECLKRSPKECTTTHFYIENKDQELVLIWRDGKMVE